MSWLLIILGTCLAIYIVWTLSSRNTETNIFEKICENMSLSQAEDQFEECRQIIFRQMLDPVNSNVSSKVARENIEFAVACKSRINEINNEEHGSAFRAKYRFILLKSIKADVDYAMGDK